MNILSPEAQQAQEFLGAVVAGYIDRDESHGEVVEALRILGKRGIKILKSATGGRCDAMRRRLSGSYGSSRRR